MIQKIIERIKQLLCQKELAEIKQLKTDIEYFHNALNQEQKEYSELHDEYEQELIDHHDCLLQLQNILSSRFYTAKNRFKKVNQAYNGKWLREYLDNFSENTILQEKYISFLKTLGLKDSYKDSDEAVYKITLMVQDYINNTLDDDYKTDKEFFGKSDYWVNPTEAFDYYVTQETAIDCDDTSCFLYCCIASALNYLGYEWQGRLLRIDIKLPVAHAVVAWLKWNGTWACIESTYHEERFGKNWVEDKDMFKGVYTEIWHIFDDRGEYRLIN